MRSTVSLVWAVAGDGAGGTLAFGWFNTFKEATDFMQSIDQGGSGAVQPTQYWVCLNKWNVGVLMSIASSAVGVSAPVTLPVVATKAEADAFGIKNPKTSIDTAWEFDDTDKSWVENIRIAAEKVGL